MVIIKRSAMFDGRITKAMRSTLHELYRSHSLNLAQKIMPDSSHSLSGAFQKIPSGRRLLQPRARTGRYRNSFVSNMTAMLNS